MRTRRPRPLVLALLAAAFFFTPAVAWLIGMRAEPIENRPFTPLPSLSDGWSGFDQLAQWGIDRLPLRAGAIRFNTELAERVFHELPTTANAGGPVGIGQGAQAVDTTGAPTGPPPRSVQVIEGSDGFLFYGDEFVRACEPEEPVAEIVARLRRLERILDASGRRLVAMVAPDKHSLSSAHLPDDLPERGCSLRAADERRAALAAAGIPGVVDLAAALERRQRELGRPIYQPTDTHWNSDGDVVYVRATMEALSPDLLERTRFVRGPRVSYVGDLTALTGATTETSDRPFAIERTGVRKLAKRTTTPLANYPMTEARFASAPGGAALYEPATLIYGDSFTQRSLDLLLPFFRDVTRIPELTRAAVSNALEPAQERLLQEIRDHRTIVLEQAERTFWGTAGSSILEPAFLDRLADELGVDAS